MDKKAVSTIVAYVLLIIIVISISVPVYHFLKASLPGAEKKCPDGVAINIINYDCSELESDQITLEIKNTGLFTIDGFIARYGTDVDKLATKKLLKVGQNRDDKDLYLVPFDEREEGDDDPALEAGDKTHIDLFTESGDIIRKVEVQPYILDEEEKETIICSAAISSQLIRGNGCN